MQIHQTTKSPILILDYGLGNLGSLVNALTFLGFNTSFVNSLEDYNCNTDNLGCILPGVGSFEHGVSAIKEKKLDVVIRELVSAEVPLLGICLGMQMLVSGSEEASTECKGLGLIPGYARKLSVSDESVPHIGWSKTKTTVKGSEQRYGVSPNLNSDFYYIHSYAVETEDHRDAVAYFNHGKKEKIAVIQRNKIMGVQFHPEKSQQSGLKLLANFFSSETK